MRLRRPAVLLGVVVGETISGMDEIYKTSK
jgi:hypothetical protein